MRFDPLKLADQLEAAARTLRDHGPAARRLAHDWATPLRSTGTRGPKGSVSDPTFTAAANPDATRDYAATLDREATHVFDHLALLLAPVVELGRAAATNTPPVERTPSAGSGACCACGQWVSGAANDRLRSGYCNACRMAWERAGRPDRTLFAASRRPDGDDGHRAQAS